MDVETHVPPPQPSLRMSVITVLRPYLKPLATVFVLFIMVLYVISGRQGTVYYTPGLQIDSDQRPEGDPSSTSAPGALSSLLPVLEASLPQWQFRPPKPAPYQRTELETSSENPNVLLGSHSQQRAETVAQIKYDDVKTDVLLEQERRSMHFKDLCFQNVILNTTYKGKGGQSYYLSRKYNVAFCKVPKVGSTFWTLLFTVLENGINFGTTLLEKKRISIHTGHYTFSSSFTFVKSSQVPTILPTRDPYSRLYSAFIDKSYLPLRIATNYDVQNIKNKTVCPKDVPFQQFLQWIINETKAGKSLNRHWAPIHSICGPCEVNAQYIVKQETFATDIDVVLQKLNVSSEKYDFIMHSLEGKRIQSSLPGIVATILDRSYGDAVGRCMPWSEVTRRIWRSFQIQGYIHEDRGYPQETFDSIRDHAEPSLASDLIMAEIFKHSMSSEERKIQREKALKRAYDGVSKDVLEAIKDLYNVDFLLYGYSNIPPNERQNE